VETLFLGSADAMRRRALPALSRFAAEPRFASSGLRLFDAATGTGRFLSFVLDSFPGVRATASDLSPYYLNKAREVLKPWESRVDAFVEANVEAVPLPDASFDAVTCVYLFHELPASARRAAAAEFARLLAPGGRLFFVDSAQRGDGEISGMPTANDMALVRVSCTSAVCCLRLYLPPSSAPQDGFPKFSHEPFYNEYTRENLNDTFGAAGLVHVETDVAWVTKVMVFEKPADWVAPPPTATHAAQTEEEPAVELVTPDATISPGDSAM
jgi:ubiquinone/menaquinone biosynthesis C-methylase UbiE